MALERTPQGLETTLRPKGFARFFAAGFLSIWLCGWAAGETFAIYVLMRGASTAGEGRLVVTAFLLVWVSVWTLGGLFAMRELLRLLWSEDRIVVDSEAIRIHRRLGPFGSTTTIARSGLSGVVTLPCRARLVARASGRTVEITALADRLECAALERELNEALALGAASPEPQAPNGLPPGWEEITDDDGRRAVIQDPATRATQAKLAWAFAGGLAIPTYLLFSRILDQPQWGALAAMLGAATAMAAWGARRLSATRLEWRPDSGRLVLRRRSESDANILFEGGSLELVERRDSDGDSWFTLNAIAVDGTKRRKIDESADDSDNPRRLGLFISGRARVRFDDRATEAHKAQELATALEQLQASGRLGRWMAGKLKGISPR